MKHIVLYLMVLLCFPVYGKTSISTTSRVFQPFDSVSISRDDTSLCVYERGEQGIVCKNIVNGKKNGFWMLLPDNANSLSCVIGQYKDDVMCGRWEVYSEKGLIQYSISNISVLSDDDGNWHNICDTTEPVYIGLWHDYDNDGTLIKTYWAIFSDIYKTGCFVILGDRTEFN